MRPRRSEPRRRLAGDARRASAAAALLAETPLARALIDGIADGSPYLWDLIERDRRAARRAAAVRSGRAPCGAARRDRDARWRRPTRDDEAMRLLRQMKAEAALLIALADIGGVWDVMRVTRALTEVADTAVGAAVRLSAGGGGARRPARAARSGAAAEGSGYIVLAMGKMGAYELNYSSDIDLIVLLRPGRRGPAGRRRAGRALRPHHPRPGPAAAGAHRRRLRVPRRPAAAARSRLDPDRDLAAGRARLLREPRPELGARRDDQGAPLRRRHRGRRGGAARARRRSSGASISTSRRSPTSTR